MSNSQKDFVTLFVDEFKKLDPNAKLAAIFATKELSERINFNSTNDEVKAVIQSGFDSGLYCDNLPDLSSPMEVRQHVKKTLKAKYFHK